MITECPEDSHGERPTSDEYATRHGCQAAARSTQLCEGGSPFSLRPDPEPVVHLRPVVVRKPAIWRAGQPR